MLTQEQLDQVVEYVSGSCQMNGGAYVHAVFEDATDADEDQFLEYMASIDLQECNNCGWFGYPGDSYDENGYCDDCVQDLADDGGEDF